MLISNPFVSNRYKWIWDQDYLHHNFSTLASFDIFFAFNFIQNCTMKLQCACKHFREYAHYKSIYCKVIII